MSVRILIVRILKIVVQRQMKADMKKVSIFTLLNTRSRFFTHGRNDAAVVVQAGVVGETPAPFLQKRVTRNENAAVEGARGEEEPSFNASAMDFLERERERRAPHTEAEFNKEIEDLRTKNQGLQHEIVRTHFLFRTDFAKTQIALSRENANKNVRQERQGTAQQSRKRK